jgi:hypothetical protein
MHAAPCLRFSSSLCRDGERYACRSTSLLVLPGTGERKDLARPNTADSQHPPLSRLAACRHAAQESQQRREPFAGVALARAVQWQRKTCSRSNHAQPIAAGACPLGPLKLSGRADAPALLRRRGRAVEQRCSLRR